MEFPLVFIERGLAISVTAIAIGKRWMYTKNVYNTKFPLTVKDEIHGAISTCFSRILQSEKQQFAKCH